MRDADGREPLLTEDEARDAAIRRVRLDAPSEDRCTRARRRGCLALCNALALACAVVALLLYVPRATEHGSGAWAHSHVLLRTGPREQAAANSTDAAATNSSDDASAGTASDPRANQSSSSSGRGAADGPSAARDDAEVETYDYIVVGAGSTGSIVSARLAAAGHSVLVLEAGGPTQACVGGTDFVVDNLTIFDVPLAWRAIVDGRLRWRHTNFWAVNATEVPFLLARGVGGCGAVNAMIVIRGQPLDFSTWGPGWQWDDIMPFYLRSEGNANFSQPREYPFHNGSGPVRVLTPEPSTMDEVSALFVESAQNAGARFNRDFNGPSRVGVGYYQFLLRDGVRDSTAAVFLNERTRPGTLELRPHAHVTRVLLDSDGNGEPDDAPGPPAHLPLAARRAVRRPRAVGVEWVPVHANGTAKNASAPPRVARARHEVVVSAGAVHSPKLLMLSGIGARAELQGAGVPVRVESGSVGAGLQDGVYTVAQWALERSYAAGTESSASADASEASMPEAHGSAEGRAAAGEHTCHPLDLLVRAQDWAKPGEGEARGLERKGAPERAEPLGPRPAEDTSFCAQQLRQYVANGTRGSGLYGAPGLAVGLFLRSPYARGVDDDIQVTLHPYNKFGFNWSYDDHELFSLEIANNHPASRGRVGLSSADPLAPASVTHPYLRDPSDVKCAHAHARAAGWERGPPPSRPSPGSRVRRAHARRACVPRCAAALRTRAAPRHV